MRDEIYMQHRALGLSRAKAAQLAGVTPGYGSKLESSAKGVLLLDRFQKRAEEELAVTRADVLQQLKDAYDIAKKQSDPLAMVAATREVAKVIGAYAPEKKEIELRVSGAVAIGQVRQMSDYDLMRLAEAGGRVLEHLPPPDDDARESRGSESEVPA